MQGRAGPARGGDASSPTLDRCNPCRGRVPSSWLPRRDGQAAVALDALDAPGAAAAKLPFDLALTLLVRGRLHRRAKQRRGRRGVARGARRSSSGWAHLPGLSGPGRRSTASAYAVRQKSSRRPSVASRSWRRGSRTEKWPGKAFMSPRTVQANLARIYRKLGIGSRAELGAHMSGERGRLKVQT